MAIPGTLKGQLRDGKVIPFVGAGVSRAVIHKETKQPLFPNWRELLEQAAARLEADTKRAHASLVRSLLDITPPEYLEAAKRAREASVSVWLNLLKQQFDHTRDTADDESLALAEAVWGLKSRLIITTNYDRVLHWTCPKKDLVIWDIQAPAEQADALRDGVGHPTVWHLHGYINNRSNLILTPDGYSRLYPEEGKTETLYKASLETLGTLLTSHTFLFIGFSLDDIRFIQQLRDVDKTFEGATGPHYVLVRADEEARIRSLNLPVEPIPFPDFGEPLIEMVRALGAIAGEEKRAEPNPPSGGAKYDPRNRVFYVPFRSKGDQVLGREDALLAVREQLTKGRRTAIGQTASFQGLGGLGKTQLAVEYTYRYRDEYPNGVIWLTADQDIDAQLTDLAEKARWVSPQSEHKYKLEIALHRLRTYSDCLIIFDNVEPSKSIREYLPEPQASPHILVTSRFDQPGFVRVPIELLGSDLSVKLLIQEAVREPSSDSEWAAAKEIAARLEGLPLALELAGAYLHHRQVSWEQYNHLLKQNPRAALLSRHVSFTDHDADLYSTLKINEEVFADEPRLKDILDLLTWSGSSPMELSLMGALLGVKDDFELTSALGLGTALRLLQKDSASESYSIHRLVREVRREDVPITERRDWAEAICQRVGDWFQDKRIEFSDLPRFESQIDHLQVWQEYAQQHAPEHASRLIWLQAYPPYHRGRYKESKEWVEKAIQLFEANKLQDSILQANLLADYGATHAYTGDYQSSLGFAERAFAIRREVLGEQHPDTAKSLNNIGATYHDLGNHRLALEYYEKALAISREVLGEQHRNTATSIGLVGRAYGGLGNHKLALEYHERALAISREVLGEQHPDTATSLNNIGGIYNNLGDYKLALEYHEKALVIRKEVLGEQHPGTAMSLGWIGSTYNSLGSHKLALEYKEKALAIEREVLGKAHPDTIKSVRSIAFTLDKLSRVSEAIQLLSDWLKELPRNHSEYEKTKQMQQRLLSESTPKGFRKPPMQRQRKKKKKK